MYSAEDYGLGEDSSEDCEHGDAAVIKRAAPFAKFFKRTKYRWLSNTAEMPHHGECCSQLMGWIFITNHSAVARAPNQAEFPASHLLNVPRIGPAVDRRARISHSGPAA